MLQAPPGTACRADRRADDRLSLLLPRYECICNVRLRAQRSRDGRVVGHARRADIPVGIDRELRRPGFYQGEAHLDCDVFVVGGRLPDLPFDNEWWSVLVRRHRFWSIDYDVQRFVRVVLDDLLL